MPETTETFAALCLRERRSRMWKQQEMAMKIGVSVAAFSSWERGEKLPRSYELALFWRAFDLDGDELLASVLAQ